MTTTSDPAEQTERSGVLTALKYRNYRLFWYGNLLSLTADWQEQVALNWLIISTTGDPVMLGYLFDPAGMEPDRYNRASSHREGAWSILTGIAANTAMARQRTVDVASMLAEAGIDLTRL